MKLYQLLLRMNIHLINPEKADSIINTYVQKMKLIFWFSTCFWISEFIRKLPMSPSQIQFRDRIWDSRFLNDYIRLKTIAGWCKSLTGLALNWKQTFQFINIHVQKRKLIFWYSSCFWIVEFIGNSQNPLPRCNNANDFEIVVF